MAFSLSMISPQGVWRVYGSLSFASFISLILRRQNVDSGCSRRRWLKCVGGSGKANSLTGRETEIPSHEVGCEVSLRLPVVRRVSFMRLLHISLIAAFSHILAKCAYRIFFPA